MHSFPKELTAGVSSQLMLGMWQVALFSPLKLKETLLLSYY